MKRPLGVVVALVLLLPLCAGAKRGALVAVAVDSAPAEIANHGGMLMLKEPGSTMIRIPASSFRMGSTPNDVIAALTLCLSEPQGHRCSERLFSDEVPAREVELSSYWIDRYEVTVREYRRCVDLGRCRPIPFAEGGIRYDRPDFPVSLVSYDDAERFCAFRSARLPTEAQFERAARGPLGRQFPWGDLYNGGASNHGRLAFDTTDASDGYAELAPVGSFPSGTTPDGVADLAGNVAEWVSDRYAPSYEGAATKDPRGPVPPKGSSARVIRGGGFSSAAAWLRNAARNSAEPDARRPDLGFRCARSANGRPGEKR